MVYKQAILVRTDLRMPRGKLASQVAHASVEAAMRAKPRIRELWRTMGAKKVVLKVKGLDELMEFKKSAEGIPNALITDAGNTFFAKPTVTCLGIGPAEESEIDRITGELKLV